MTKKEKDESVAAVKPDVACPEFPDDLLFLCTPHTGAVEQEFPDYRVVVKGEPSSKANSRRLVWIGGKKRFPRLLLSKAAEQYGKVFLKHIRAKEVPVGSRGGPWFPSCDVIVRMKIYYSTRRKDLDESLVLDLLQGSAYANDRQVKHKVISWGIDKLNPRVEIVVRQITLVDGGGDGGRKRALAKGHNNSSPRSGSRGKKKGSGGQVVPDS